MSSNGDDLDDDELLQIALKEQAQRDLNYRRPSQQQQLSKPVRNYIQSPTAAVRKSNSSTPGMQQQQRNTNSNSNRSSGISNNQQRKVMEDDDDYEVQMLSISFGDEDASYKERAGFGGRGKGGIGRGGSGGRGGRDDDKGWQSGSSFDFLHFSFLSSPSGFGRTFLLLEGVEEERPRTC